MSVTFIHTADWQIGKPFAGIADDTKRILVQQERIKCVERIGLIANQRGASFILVAGDLFDSTSPTKAEVAATCAAIGQIGLPVLAIPGNHDHGGPGGVWEQEFFLSQQERLAPNLRVLLSAAPVELDNAVVFPCPLMRRHEPEDTTAWLRDPSLDLARFGGKPRIVLAHGSVQGFGAESDDDDVGGCLVNQIDLGRLPAGRFDYIALGDWHGLKQVDARTWYCGTPEIDRFPKGDGNRPGHVLAVTATRDGVPVAREIPTGRFKWHDHSVTFAGDGSLDVLDQDISTLLGNRAGEDLLVLHLEGSLGIEASGRLEKILEGLEARLLRLKLADHTTIAPTGEEIAALTQRASDPLISRVASRLVAEAAGNGDEADTARLALRELHAACRV